MRLSYGKILTAVALVSGLVAGTVTAPAATIERNVAVLQALDKITARITTIDAPVNAEVRFGTLKILVRRCVTRPPEEPPESTAYVEISENRSNEGFKPVFTGWMFASSPAVSSMEHPVYDVWVVSCKKAESSESESSTGNVAAPSSADESR